MILVGLDILFAVVSLGWNSCMWDEDEGREGREGGREASGTEAKTVYLCFWRTDDLILRFTTLMLSCIYSTSKQAFLFCLCSRSRIFDL